MPPDPKVAAPVKEAPRPVATPDIADKRSGPAIAGLSPAVGVMSLAPGLGQPSGAAGSQRLAREISTVPPGRDPRQPAPSLARVTELLTGVRDVLQAVVSVGNAIPTTSDDLQNAKAHLNLAIADLRAELAATTELAAMAAPGHQIDPKHEVSPEVDRYLDVYIIPGQPVPAPTVLATRTTQLERGLRLALMVQAKADQLVELAKAVGDPDIARAYHDLLARYLDLFVLPQQRSFTDLAFLNSFFANPAVVECYAIAAVIRVQHPALVSALILNVWSEEGIFKHAHEQTSKKLSELRAWPEKTGTMPRSSQDSGYRPTARDNRQMIVDLAECRVRIAVLTIWTSLERLRTQLASAMYAGTSLNPFAVQARPRWETTIKQTELALDRELQDDKHNGIEERSKQWVATVEGLRAEILPAVATRKVIAGVLEQVPLMVVTAGTATAVGAWIGASARASLVLTAIGEGATATALSTLAHLPSGKVTIGGTALELVNNVFFAGIGRVLAGSGSATVGELSATRRALQTGRLVAVPVTLAGMQTAVQAIEARAKHDGGETNATQLFTINLLTNLLGMLFGAAFHSEGKGITSEQLAQRLGIDVAAARECLALADRYSKLEVRLGLSRGRMSAAELAAWRDETLTLLDDLETHLPRLARALGRGLSPEQVTASIGKFRARVLAMRPDDHGVIALPEYTEGLHATDDNTTWVADEHTNPAALARLKSSMGAEHIVTDLPAKAGWRAVDGTGRTVLQVLTGSRAVAGLLPPSLEALAGSDEWAMAGAEAVRDQSDVPALREKLAMQSVGEAGAARVRALLRAAGQLARSAQQGTIQTILLAEAANDPVAATGLVGLATRFGPSHRTALARIVAALPTENVSPFLRAVADPKLGGLPVEFYQALARNRPACELVSRYGGEVLMRVVRMQGDRGIDMGTRLARARVDVERVLTGPGSGRWTRLSGRGLRPVPASSPSPTTPNGASIAQRPKSTHVTTCPPDHR
jgi:hypothetical protein